MRYIRHWEWSDLNGEQDLQMKDLNRIKVVLVEKKRTAKWLAEELGKNPATVSKWCTNVSQPDLYTLDKIATLLDIDKRELITGKD